jgi:hypothetical protein
MAEKAAFEMQHKLNKPVAHNYELVKVESPGYFAADVPQADEFLDGMVRVLVTVDSKTLRDFTAPLVVRGNFNYAPQYDWGIIEAKGYYANIPVLLYDDGSHGDAKAGDGVWSLAMNVRKNSGRIWFELWDGRYLIGYWNHLHPEWFRSKNCLEVSSAWGKLLNGPEGGLNGIPTDKDIELNWTKASMDEAVQKGYLYSPAANSDSE